MTNKHQRVLSAGSIGSIAFDVLAGGQVAHVFGNTSKGIFIKTTEKWLVFVSFESFKGPLTINLDGLDPALQLVPAGSPVRISFPSITFPDCDLSISTAGSQVYRPVLPNVPPLDDSMRYENLVHIAEGIPEKNKEAGLGSLIPPLLGLPDAQPPPAIVNGFGWADIQRLINHIQEDFPSLTQQLSGMLGAGPGLTPSADDFIIGLLLTINRWHIPLYTGERLSQLNLRLIDDAYTKTTSLSANLIECATQGLANERLINALDWIVTGVAPKPEIIAHLLGWGNSSGVDAFTGMVVALLS